MHCFSSRVTSWLTRTLRVGGFVLRRHIGASVIRPLHLGWPTQQQRRAQEAVAVLGSQTIPWDRHRQIKGKFCTVVGGVDTPDLADVLALASAGTDCIELVEEIDAPSAAHGVEDETELARGLSHELGNEPIKDDGEQRQ